MRGLEDSRGRDGPDGEAPAEVGGDDAGELVRVLLDDGGLDRDDLVGAGEDDALAGAGPEVALEDGEDGAEVDGAGGHQGGRVGLYDDHGVLLSGGGGGGGDLDGLRKSVVFLRGNVGSASGNVYL